MDVTNSEKHAVAAILRGLGDSERNAILREADRLSGRELDVVVPFGIGITIALKRAGFVSTDGTRLWELLADFIDTPTAHAIQRRPGAFYECSACGQDAWTSEGKVTRFCPNCGARMIEGERNRDYE